MASLVRHHWQKAWRTAAWTYRRTIATAKPVNAAAKPRARRSWFRAAPVAARTAYPARPTAATGTPATSA